MSDFLMPSLGADMDAGILVEWLVKPGQQVKRGDVVAVVETEKGAIEIEIFESGEISELVVPVGAKVPVGTLLARLGGTGGASSRADCGRCPRCTIQAAHYGHRSAVTRRAEDSGLRPQSKLASG